MLHPQKKFMQAAIEQALLARQKGDYSIGAVVVKDGEIVGRGMNRAKIDQDPTQHAELIAIREATKNLHSRFIEGCILYTTHEPCPMCTSAAVWAKMKGIVYGAKMEDMAEFCSKNANKEWTWRTIKISAQEILAKSEPALELEKEFMRDECLKLFHN